MYSVFDYGRMATDGVRMNAYARAIERVVRPGDVVVDLGAGTGIMSLLALRAGARHVHAIEPNPAVWALPELAAENGFDGRITVHHRSSFDVHLDERADVLISDMRGPTPLHSENATAVRDARARLLKLGGISIPIHDRLFVAMAESPGLDVELSRATESFSRFGLKAEATRSLLLNSTYRDASAPLRQSDLVSSSACWGTLDYAAEDARVIEGTVELTPLRAARARWLAIWFEATILDEIGFKTEPGWALAYGRMVLPLLETVPLALDDRATITLRADEDGQRWAWDTRVRDGAHEPKAQYRQASFLGAPASAELMLRESTTFRPRRSDKGDRAARALDALDGKRTVAEIAEAALSSGASSLTRARCLAETRELVARYAK